MTINTRNAQAAAGRDRRSERTQMHRLFLICLPLCLISETANRIVHSFDKNAAKPATSIFAEARASAYAVAGYAFHV